MERHLASADGRNPCRLGRLGSLARARPVGDDASTAVGTSRCRDRRRCTLLLLRRLSDRARVLDDAQVPDADRNVRGSAPGRQLPHQRRARTLRLVRGVTQRSRHRDRARRRQQPRRRAQPRHHFSPARATASFSTTLADGAKAKAIRTHTAGPGGATSMLPSPGSSGGPTSDICASAPSACRQVPMFWSRLPPGGATSAPSSPTEAPAARSVTSGAPRTAPTGCRFRSFGRSTRPPKFSKVRGQDHPGGARRPHTAEPDPVHCFDLGDRAEGGTGLRASCRRTRRALGSGRRAHARASRSPAGIRATGHRILQSHAPAKQSVTARPG